MNAGEESRMKSDVGGDSWAEKLLDTMPPWSVRIDGDRETKETKPTPPAEGSERDVAGRES